MESRFKGVRSNYFPFHALKPESESIVFGLADFLCNRLNFFHFSLFSFSLSLSLCSLISPSCLCEEIRNTSKSFGDKKRWRPIKRRRFHLLVIIRLSLWPIIYTPQINYFSPIIMLNGPEPLIQSLKNYFLISVLKLLYNFF